MQTVQKAGASFLLLLQAFLTSAQTPAGETLFTLDEFLNTV
jgi:hypothetical protein